MSIRERLARTPPGYRYSIGRILAIYSGLMVTLLLAALDQTILATALPRIVGDLGGLTQYSWVFTAYLLATTVTVPIYGKLGDVYGRRPLFLIAICIFLVGSALCGARAEHDAARRLPRGSGSGRRRLDPARARGDREPRPAARPRPLPGTDRRRVRRRVDHRPGDRRLHRRQHDVALDLLRQPARRRARAGRHLDHDAASPRRRAALDRLARRRPCSRWGRPRCCSGSCGADASTRGARRTSSARSRRQPSCSSCSASGSGASRSRSCRSTSCETRSCCRASSAWRLIGMAMFGTIAYVPLFVQGVIGTSATSSGVVLDAAHARRGDDVVLRGSVGLADGPLPRERHRRAAHPRGRDDPALAHGRPHDERRGGAQHGRLPASASARSCRSSSSPCRTRCGARRWAPRPR